MDIRPYKKGFRAYFNKIPISRKPVEIERAIQQAYALEKKGKAEEVRSYPLGEDDVKKIIPTLKVLSYPELLKATHIDQVLDDKGRLLLLYLTIDKSTGHWVCLLKRRNTDFIEYFDPYGNFKPDGESKWLSAQKLKEFGQASHHLTKLLESSPYEVKSNAYPFQEDRTDMNTCGRHCVTRLYLKHLSLPEYIKLIESTGLSADDFVSGFTYNLIGH
jgi:hypothetical protein